MIHFDESDAGNGVLNTPNNYYSEIVTHLFHDRSQLIIIYQFVITAGQQLGKRLSQLMLILRP